MNKSSWAMKATAARTAMIHHRAGCPSPSSADASAAVAADGAAAVDGPAVRTPAASAFDIVPPGQVSSFTELSWQLTTAFTVQSMNYEAGKCATMRGMALPKDYTSQDCSLARA